MSFLSLSFNSQLDFALTQSHLNCWYQLL